jgi:acyl-CoA hydrolase
VLARQTLAVPPVTLSAADAAKLVRPVDTIGFGLGPANPPAYLRALSARDDFEDLTIGGALLLGLFDLVAKPGVHYRCGFYGPVERWYKAKGADIQLVPAGFRQFAPVLERLAPRVMAVQAAPPDGDGRCNLSLHYGATRDELLRAGRDPDRVLVVELNAALPRTTALEGFDNTVPLALADVVVESDEALVALPGPETTEADERIAELALRYVQDGTTLQTGIGAIPSMVAARLAESSGGEYGVHSEMFTDGLMALHEAGKVTNARKGQFDGVSVTTFALGSLALYGWLDANRDVAFAPVSIVNDPSVIQRNRRFVSINGAIQVDLYGQVVADAVGGHQISGVGGHEDFIAGADLETEDRSLVCLRSTVEVHGERRSRIVGSLDAGSVVSTPRHHTGTVITEFGAADLAGRTVRERAEALTSISHPAFRDELEAAARLLDA